MKRFLDWLKDDGFICVLLTILIIICVVLALLAAFGVIQCTANGNFNTSQWVANPANPASPLFH